MAEDRGVRLCVCSRGRTYMTTCARVHSSIRKDHYVDGCVKLGGRARDMEVGGKWQVKVAYVGKDSGSHKSKDQYTSGLVTNAATSLVLSLNVSDFIHQSWLRKFNICN